jgi:catechol 2,3-dioxygenase-like lactoylglutathione lyase family enzyme
MTVERKADYDITPYGYTDGGKPTRRTPSLMQPQATGWRAAAQVESVSTRTEEDRSVATRMKLRNLIPVLDVRDVETSIEFYCGALGFVLNDKVEWGGRTEWALLQSEHMQLMLCAGHETEIEDAVRSDDSVFFLYHDDPESLLSSLGSHGYDERPEVLQPDGKRRDFFLRDPDGYVLWFSHKPMGTGPG